MQPKTRNCCSVKYTIGDLISTNQFDSLLDAIILAIFCYNGFLINFVLQSPLLKHSELRIVETLLKEVCCQEYVVYAFSCMFDFQAMVFAAIRWRIHSKLVCFYVYEQQIQLKKIILSQRLWCYNALNAFDNANSSD